MPAAAIPGPPARRGRARAGRGPARASAQAGYALLVILLLFSLLALAIAAAVPSWTTEIRRQREQTEIDYAREYVMGIRRYYHKFGTYPPNLERLEETDNQHYLRRAWPDPLSKDGKWRFVHPGDIEVPRPPGAQQGTGLEDLMQPNAPGGNAPAAPAAPGGGFGQNSIGGAMGGAVGGAMGGAMPGAGGGPTGGVGGGAAGVFGGGPGSGMGGRITPGAGGGGAAGLFGGGPGSGVGGGITPGMPGTGGVPVGGAGGIGLPPLALGALPPLDGDVVGYFILTPAAAKRTDEVMGAPIIGVASRNDKPAVHAFRKQDRASDWVFVYDPAADRRGMGGAGIMPPQPGSPMPGMPGSPAPTPIPQQPSGPRAAPPFPPCVDCGRAGGAAADLR